MFFHIEEFETLFWLRTHFIEPNCSRIPITSINNIRAGHYIHIHLFPMLPIFRLRITSIKALTMFVYRSGSGQIPHFKLLPGFIIPYSITERSSIRSTFKSVFPFLIRSKYRIILIEHSLMGNTLHIRFCNQKIIDEQLTPQIYRNNIRFVQNIRQRHFATYSVIHHARRPLLGQHNTIM